MCETLLDGDVSDSELQLKEYKLFRVDRPSTKDYSTHGGSLIAVKSMLVSKQLDIVSPESCVACSITLDNLEILCTLYNPPDDIKYRYEISHFEQILDSLPKTTQHAVKMRLECSHQQQKPIFEKYRSYGRAHYRKMIDIMSTRRFSPVCHTNIDNMYSELSIN